MYRYLKYIILPLIYISFFSACEKRNDIGVSDNDSAQYELYDYYEDQYGNKGIVAYVYDYEEDGEFMHLKVVLSLDETTAFWGPMGTTVYDVNSKFNEAFPSGPFFGLVVNQRVHNLGAENYPAFDWCFKKNGNEQMIHSSSWILPTYKELRRIFVNEQRLQTLNSHLLAYNGTPIASPDEPDAYYWSCVEDIKDVLIFADEQYQQESDYDPARRAIPMTTNNMFYTNKLYWNKNREYKVRAIKYIYFAQSPDTED